MIEIGTERLKAFPVEFMCHLGLIMLMSNQRCRVFFVILNVFCNMSLGL